MAKINNYRFQQQQKAKQEYQKVKKIKEKSKVIPVNANEELDYIKKLLNGEDVEDFGPKEVESNKFQNDGIFGIEYWFANGKAVPTAYWKQSARAQKREIELLEYVRKNRK